MRKTFKYRIYPSRNQTKKLQKTLGCCRKVYNIFLADRKQSYESIGKSPSCYTQMAMLPSLKIEFPYLKGANAQVLQNVSTRIDLAFQAFFRRVKRGQTPGYPRFRSQNRYDSFTHSQSGFRVIEEKSVIQLSKIGRVKIKYHRPIQGTIKCCTVKKTPTGKWFVSLSCIIKEYDQLPKTKKQIGIDVGVSSFVAFSDGRKIDNPRFFRRETKALAKAQRKFSKQKTKSSRKVVARVHERIANKRHNFAHQISKKLVDEFDLIVVEDLSINDMMKDNPRCLNRAISDVAWSKFINCISYKAECAGKKCIKVNPAYTSQNCSKCGNRQKLKLSNRVYSCPCCGLILDRDHNAAINILTLGTQGLANA